MFVLMLDDGTPYGPFDTAEAAVRCDLQAMAIDSLPAYQSRAKKLLDLNGLYYFKPDQWYAAQVLVGEVDHVVFEWKIVVGGLNGESYDDVLGGGLDANLHTPDQLIANAQRWAKSGIRPGETKKADLADMAPGEVVEIHGK